MTFSIWYGGVRVDNSAVAAAIRAADADIVALQEPEGMLRTYGTGRLQRSMSGCT